MPFEVFRRHQRKLLADLRDPGHVRFRGLGQPAQAAQSQLRAGATNPSRNFPARQSIAARSTQMLEQRTLANMFVSELNPYVGRHPFGAHQETETWSTP